MLPVKPQRYRMLGRWLMSSASKRVVARCSRSFRWRAGKSMAGECNRRRSAGGPLSTQYSVLSTQYSETSTQCSVLSTQKKQLQIMLLTLSQRSARSECDRVPQSCRARNGHLPASDSQETLQSLFEFQFLQPILAQSEGIDKTRAANIGPVLRRCCWGQKQRLAAIGSSSHRFHRLENFL